MSYQEWKELYIAILKNKIKSHKYSINYTEHYINELCQELLERGGFHEDYGHWECVTAEHASQESFDFWLKDSFTNEEKENENLTE